MNIFYGLSLFFAALIPGMSVIFLKKRFFKYHSEKLLVFAGTYIFSITLVHLLPEIFSNAENPAKMGLFVLTGFFMQIFIDFLTSGVEHGHIHLQHQEHKHLSPLLLMTGLTLHAIMDGSVLAQPAAGTVSGISDQQTGLLFGIILHKIPAATVLMVVLMWTVRKKTLLVIFLLIFSIASPFGLWAGEVLSRSNAFGSETFLIILALVSGNFLHISTSIFMESGSEQKYDFKKILAGISGIILALLSEFLPF